MKSRMDGSLTGRERDVLNALRKGRRYKEIACDLGIGLETVRHHIKNLYRKLEANSRAEAILRLLTKDLD